MIYRFEWDRSKAAANVRKHGVSFEEARSIFYDQLSLTKYDEKDSNYEERFVSIGFSERGRLLIFAHADEGDIVRIISARTPTRIEANQYTNRGY